MKFFGVDLKDFFNKKKLEELEKKIDELKPKNKFIYNLNTKQMTVIMEDGEVITGIAEADIAERVKVANDRDLIIKLLEEKKDDSHVEEQTVSNFLDNLEKQGDYEIKGNKAYFKGITNIPIPTIVAGALIEAIDSGDKEKYNSLKMFTYWLLLNPIEASRDRLLQFCRVNKVQLTKNGNLILYRRIVKETKNNNDLVEFITSSWIKVKKWKKSPKNYTILEENGELILGKVDSKDDGQAISHGNLHELYNTIEQFEENKYFSHHNKVPIKLGAVYNIPDEEVDLDAGNCASGGLHCCSLSYDYSGFGNTPVVVLVNPSKAIMVPYSEEEKMRVSEMFIVGVHENPNEHVSEDFVANFDEEYCNSTLEELDKSLREKSLATVSVSKATSELTIKEVKDISTLLKSRVVTI